MGKIIFLDIDGTLTLPGSNFPPESALEAVRLARKNGHKVLLCTGRNPAMMAPVSTERSPGQAATWSAGTRSCSTGPCRTTSSAWV